MTNRHESVAASSELTELIATNASNRPVAVMRRGSRSREEQHFWESSVEQADEQPSRVRPCAKNPSEGVLIAGTHHLTTVLRGRNFLRKTRDIRYLRSNPETALRQRCAR